MIRVSTIGRMRSEPSMIPAEGARRSTSSGERGAETVDWAGVAVNTAGRVVTGARRTLPTTSLKDSENVFLLFTSANAGFRSEERRVGKEWRFRCARDG